METLIPTSPWQISPIADSGYRCADCLRWLSSTEAAGVINYPGKCTVCTCGKDLLRRSSDVILGIRGDSAHYRDEATTLATTWYHATTCENWDAFVARGEYMVHLGTREAALERAKGFGDDEPIYLYEVTLDPQAPIAAEVFLDDDHWPSTPECCHPDYDVWGDFVPGVNRYVNAVEAPGSISLLAATAYVRILTRTETWLYV